MKQKVVIASLSILISFCVNALAATSEIGLITDIALPSCNLDLQLKERRVSDNIAREQFKRLETYMNTKIKAQNVLVKELLIAILVNGHVLAESPRGAAKTRSVKTLATAAEGTYKRIQFTSDLMPSEITGSMVFDHNQGKKTFHKGPLFANYVHADEINRAPPKTQSALFEAMGEGHVSIEGETFPTPDIFLVLATQNPYDKEGTYPLPDPELDRFLFRTKLVYPDAQTEKDILSMLHQELRDKLEGTERDPDKLTKAAIMSGRRHVLDVTIPPKIVDYIVAIVHATRKDSELSTPQIRNNVELGASPRATQALAMASRASAWLDGRTEVSVDDVDSVAIDILNHRILLTDQAKLEQVEVEPVVKAAIEQAKTLVFSK